MTSLAATGTLVTFMDIIDQVARLVSELEETQQRRRASEETSKAILLHAAAGEYVQRVKNRNWRAARDGLAGILYVVVNMLPDLPQKTKGNGDGSAAR